MIRRFSIKIQIAILFLQNLKLCLTGSLFVHGKVGWGWVVAIPFPWGWRLARLPNVHLFLLSP